MGGYLDAYERGEKGRERRNRIVKWVVIACILVLIAIWILHLIFHNRAEVQKAKQFLAQVNAQHYQQAYAVWGCTQAHPCPNYDYQRFMEDWGPNTAKSPWKISSVDGCKHFVTINVKAKGAESQSLAVERAPLHVLSFAPAAQCMEKQWHWKNFFHRIFGGGQASASG